MLCSNLLLGKCGKQELTLGVKRIYLYLVSLFALTISVDHDSLHRSSDEN